MPLLEVKEAGEQLTSFIKKAINEGRTIKLYYHTAIDDIAAASNIFIRIKRLRGRVVAKSLTSVVDVRSILSGGSYVLVVGGLAKSEYQVYTDGFLHISAMYEPEHPNLISPGRYNVKNHVSNSLWVYRVLECEDKPSTIRALVGYESTFLNVITDLDHPLNPGDIEVVNALEKKGFIKSVSSLLLPLRKTGPLDLSISLSYAPPVEPLIGNPHASRDVLVEAGLCRGSCETLEEVEGDSDKARLLEDTIKRVSSDEVLKALKGRRTELRDSNLGWQADLRDLAYVEHSYLAIRGPVKAFRESLEGFVSSGSEGLSTMLQLSKTITRTSFMLRRLGVRDRGLYSEPSLDPQQRQIVEASLCSMLFIQGMGAGLIGVRLLTTAKGSMYLITSRSWGSMEKLLKKLKKLGAHYVITGAQCKAWVPPEVEDELKESIVSGGS